MTTMYAMSYGRDCDATTLHDIRFEDRESPAFRREGRSIDYARRCHIPRLEQVYDGERLVLREY